jgi:saccharopine dehydrogenase-like NADP-dependent oxidoreductase
MQKKVSAVVLGGSGNVGKEAVKALVASNLYSTITLVSRRPLPEMEALHPSIKVIVCDLDKIQ